MACCNRHDDPNRILSFRRDTGTVVKGCLTSTRLLPITARLSASYDSDGQRLDHRSIGSYLGPNMLQLSEEAFLSWPPREKGARMSRPIGGRYRTRSAVAKRRKYQMGGWKNQYHALDPSLFYNRVRITNSQSPQMSFNLISVRTLL
jgi:hypothetical protein